MDITRMSTPDEIKVEVNRRYEAGEPLDELQPYAREIKPLYNEDGHKLPIRLNTRFRGSTKDPLPSTQVLKQAVDKEAPREEVD